MDFEAHGVGGKRYLHNEGVIVVSVAMRLFARPAEGEHSVSTGGGRFSWRALSWGVASGVGGKWDSGSRASLNLSVFALRSGFDLRGVSGMWWEMFRASDVSTLGASSCEW